MSEFKLNGGPELLTLLDQLPARLAGNVLRSGIRAAGKVVLEEARLLAPKGTGKLAKSIKLGSPKYDRAEQQVRVRVKIGGDKGNKGNDHAFLGMIYEFGSAAYAGQKYQRDGRTRTRSVKLKFDGTTIYGRFPNIAGHAARPFMRPALDAKASEAVKVMGEHIARRLTWRELQAPTLAPDLDGDD